MSGLDRLNDQQRQTLMSFQDISQIDDIDLCIQILSSNNWNFNDAIDSYVNDSSSSGFTNEVQSSTTSNRNPFTSRNNNYQSLSTNDEEISQHSSNQNNIQSGGILSYIFTPLTRLLQSETVSINPDNDTRRFINEFELNYSTQHPTLHERSYQSAVANAFDSSKFLFVYLHSPMHEDTQKFCQQTFCTQSFSSFADQNMITWIGKVWDPEAYGLSIQYKVSAFPYCALLVCQSQRSVQIIAKFQGYYIFSSCSNDYKLYLINY